MEFLFGEGSTATVLTYLCIFIINICKSLFTIVLLRELIFYTKIKLYDYADNVPVINVDLHKDIFKSFSKSIEFLQIDSNLKHNKQWLLFFRVIGGTSGIIAFSYELFECGHPWYLMLTEIMCGIGTVSVLVVTFKITRSKIGKDRILKRSNHHVGPGFAVAQYRFLENIIKGKNGTPPHTEMLRRFKEAEMHEVEEKVIILFPESSQEMGSIEALIEREQTKQNRRKSRDDKMNSSHRVLFETIKYEYPLVCQVRTAQIHVVQVIETDDTPTAKVTETAKKRYFAMVENRPLKAMHNMVTDSAIKFTREDFKIQLHIYMNHLKKLLDKDPKCKGKYEILHIKDKSVDIGSIIIDKMNSRKAKSNKDKNSKKCQ